jgi:hypothetical protein
VTRRGKRPDGGSAEARLLVDRRHLRGPQRVVVHMLTGTDDLWFYWPMLGTGLIVAITGIAMFGVSGLFGGFQLPGGRGRFGAGGAHVSAEEAADRCADLPFAANEVRFSRIMSSIQFRRSRFRQNQLRRASGWRFPLRGSGTR